MLKVKMIDINGNTFYVDNVTNYVNAINVAQNKYFPIFKFENIKEICHVDEYGGEMEHMSGDELKSYLSHREQINLLDYNDCYFENSNIKIKHSIIS